MDLELKPLKDFFAGRVSAAFRRFPEVSEHLPFEVEGHAIELLTRFTDAPHLLSPISELTGDPIHSIDEFIEDARDKSEEAPQDYEWRRLQYLANLIVFTVGFMCPSVPAIPPFKGRSRGYLLDVAQESYSELSLYRRTDHRDERLFFGIISPYTEFCAIGLQSVKESMRFP